MNLTNLLICFEKYLDIAVDNWHAQVNIDMLLFRKLVHMQMSSMFTKDLLLILEKNTYEHN